MSKKLNQQDEQRNDEGDMHTASDAADLFAAADSVHSQSRNSDCVKATVSGPLYFSVGDLEESFIQVDNEPETSRKCQA